MTDKIALLLEAERRGILPPDKAPLLAEAKRRGLVGGQAPQQAQQQEEPGYWSQRMGELKALGQGARFNIAETALGVGQLVGAADEQDVANFRDKRQQAVAEVGASSGRGEDFFGVGDAAGALVQTAAPMMRVGRIPGVAGVLGGTAAGATYGVTRPVAEGESRGRNTAISAAAGGMGQLVGNGIAALGRVAPEAVRNTFQAAKDRGVKLTGAQVSDSEYLKRFAHLSDKLPGSGATNRMATQTAAVNREIAKEFGAKVNADGVIDADVMARRYAQFDGEFDKVLSNGMQLDRQFLVSLAEARRQAAEGMDDTAARTVETVIDRLRRQAKGGQLNGRALQSIDQFLRKADTGGGDRQLVAGELRDALHDTFARTGPPNIRPAWDKVRKDYAIYKQLEPLVASNPDGPISPTLLTGALKANKMGKARMARNEAGELGTLAGVGRRMRGPQTSGTPEGAQTAAVGYGLMANPVSTLGLLISGNTAGRVANSHGLARLLMSEGRGRVAPFAPYARPLPLMLSGPAYANQPERP